MVKDFRPEFVVMENVTGLMAKKNETSLKAIVKLFNKLGYNIDVNILSAQQYGVPEKEDEPSLSAVELIMKLSSLRSLT